jgi:hypothetical protein
MFRERFLLSTLGFIFLFQIGMFGVSLKYCMDNGGLQTCPDIADTYEKTFNVMISTTLALLTGTNSIS